MNSVEAYDPISNTWTEMAPILQGRVRARTAAVTATNRKFYVVARQILLPLIGHGSATACNGKIYVMGTPAHVLKYDINGDLWTSITPTMPSGGRTGLTVVSLNQYIYAIGGYRRFGNPPGTQTTNDAYGLKMEF